MREGGREGKRKVGMKDDLQREFRHLHILISKLLVGRESSLLEVGDNNSEVRWLGYSPATSYLNN